MALTQPRPMTRRYVQCRFCAKQITLNNIGTHVKAQHREHGRRPRGEMYLEIDRGDALPAVVATSDQVSPPGPASLAVSDPASPPDLAPLGLEDLDDIVLTVTAQLAEPTGMLAVIHLPALFAWREATAQFLRSVHHEH